MTTCVPPKGDGNVLAPVLHTEMGLEQQPPRLREVARRNAQLDQALQSGPDIGRLRDGGSSPSPTAGRLQQVGEGSLKAGLGFLAGTRPWPRGVQRE